MINPLKNYRILIVDADVELAKVLKIMLADMGFSNVYHTRSGKDAIQQIRDQTFDFVITEWHTQHIDGLALLQYIRRNPASPNPTLPIIMLTGRAEMVDVMLVRDYGINEYVVKPFTAKTIYSRLQRLIEQPRSFVFAESFIGPDRRNKSKPPEGVDERRTVKPVTEFHAKDVAKHIKGGKPPLIWLPDFSLKLKLGKGLKLDDFITPEILSKAQAGVDAISDQSLVWIKESLRELSELHASLVNGTYPENICDELGEVALRLNSRAGTFGYSRAAEISYALYLFTRNNFAPENKSLHMLIKKHIEVLNVIFGNKMSGSAGAVGAQIAAELKALISKYS